MAGETIGTQTKLAEVPSVGDPVLISNITAINPDGITRESIDVTDLDATNGAMEFIPGLIDAGQVNLELNYTKANNSTIQGYMRQPKTWLITFPDASTFGFDGTMTGLQNTVHHDSHITSTASIKVTGKPEFTPA